MSLSSAGTPSDGTATIRSPASASPSRLVASTDTRAQRWLIVVTWRAIASSRCSQLSSTSNNRFAARYSSTDSSRLRPGKACTRNDAASVSHTASGSATGANSHSHAPLGKSATTSAATCNARRVLPTPPTPVRVTNDDCRQRISDAPRLDLTADERRHLHAASCPATSPTTATAGTPLQPRSAAPGTRAPTTASRAADARPDRPASTLAAAHQHTRRHRAPRSGHRAPRPSGVPRGSLHVPK